ncbi:MAG TPA: translation initiation factor [Pseudomonadales bacterium]|nr:translation initiation factor [Pseudomonadales bacterium]
MGKKSPRQDSAEPAPASAFAALATLRGTLPAGPAPEPAAATTRSPFTGRIVITHERKGRGGKTVTLVRGIDLDGDALEALVREMRQALGTGGAVEGDAIVLHGEQSTRIAEWLAARGATRVVRGN